MRGALLVRPLTAALGAAAVVAGFSELLRAKPVAQPAPESVRLTISGMTNNGCVAPLQACLERVPGVSRVEVSLGHVAARGGSERDLVAAVRASGHEVAGWPEPDPLLPLLSPADAAALDSISGDWLVLRADRAPCAACRAALPDRLRECRGVLEVSVVESSILVSRASSLSASGLVAFARGGVRSPVSATGTKLLLVAIAGMQCDKCISRIDGVLQRTLGVVRSSVSLGSATVIVTSSTEPGSVLQAIDLAPAPT